MERQIEARPVDDGMGSMVRCLTFAHTYITNCKYPKNCPYIKRNVIKYRFYLQHKRQWQACGLERTPVVFLSL